MLGPQFPQTRPIHSITEPQAGSEGTHDPAAQQAPTQKALFAAPFGVMVIQGSGGYGKVGPGSTGLVGATVISNLAGGLKVNEPAYVVDDAMAVIRKGYLHVKIDPDNKPSVGGPIRVSFASGKEGWLTSSSTSSLAVDAYTGLKIETVYDTVAEVCFSGNPTYKITGS